MRTWTPGTKVRFKIPHGANALILRYEKEGFWRIQTVPDERILIAHEDDLQEGFRNVGEE